MDERCGGIVLFVQFGRVVVLLTVGRAEYV